MKKYSKWFLALAGIIIILLAALFLIVSNVIKNEATKQKVQTFIFEKAGGEIEYERMNIFLLPSPHINVANGDFSIPGKLDARFKTLIVYPKIFPLLRGKVDIGQVRLLNPEIKLMTPERTFHEEEEELMVSSDDIKKGIRKALGYLLENGQGLNVRIVNGSFSLLEGSDTVLTLENTQASLSLPNGILNFNITSDSDLWNRIIARGSIDASSYKGSANLKLNAFTPHELAELFKYDFELVKDSLIDLDVDIRTDNLDSADFHIESDVRKLTLIKNDKELDISARDIDADISVDPQGKHITLNKAVILYPELSVSGRYDINNDKGRHELFLSGSGVNVDQARESTLLVAGEEKAVRILFEIVKGGTVPDITVSASGNSFKDMWRNEGYEINGNMVDGSIFIPGAELDITNASGNAVISNGSLKGTNLRGRTGNSNGYDGTLTVGIEGKEGPLDLDIMVDGDVTDVPPVLERFIDDPTFISELRKFKNLRGRASGKLLVGDNKVKPNPEIEVTQFDISTDYERLPSKLTVSGGGFNYVDKKIDIENVTISAGKMSSRGISGSFTWSDEHKLDISTGATQIDLGEFYPWLSSLGDMNRHLGILDSVDGSADISAIDFSGPVMTPADWKVDSSGIVSQLQARLSGVDRVITIPKTSYEASTKEIKIPKTKVLSGANELDVSLILSDYLSGVFGMVLRFTGSVDPETGNKVARIVNVPDWLVLQSPANFDESSVTLKNNYLAGNSINTGRAARNVVLDIGIVTDNVQWQSGEYSAEDKKASPEPDSDRSDGTDINGQVTVSAQKFGYKRFDWDNVDANIGFDGDTIDIKVDEATLCGIATPGTVMVASRNISFHFNPETDGENFEYTIKCLLDKAGILSGEFDFDGDIKSESGVLTDASYPELMKSLRGNFELTSKNGFVSKFGGLAKFFSALNFGDIFRGDTQGFSEDGFSYKLLTVKAKVDEGKLYIEEALLDGTSLKIAGEGSIDILEKTMDLEMLVIPVMAIDSVIDKIPLISSILGEKAVSLPVKVTGSISDPEIQQISPHTLRAGLLGLIKETLNIPATIVKPVNKDDQNKKGGTEESAQPESDVESKPQPEPERDADSALF